MMNRAPRFSVLNTVTYQLRFDPIHCYQFQMSSGLPSLASELRRAAAILTAVLDIARAKQDLPPALDKAAAECARDLMEMAANLARDDHEVGEGHSH